MIDTLAETAITLLDAWAALGPVAWIILAAVILSPCFLRTGSK
jgi:hypothetical protein